MLAELKQWNAPAEVIEQWEAQSKNAGTIEVLACNWRIVEVFGYCAMTFAGLGHCVGITMQEARAALSALCIPRKRWRRIAGGVVLMGRKAAEIVNRR